MWKSVCCEVQGRGHLKTNTPCQDKTKQLIQNNVHIVALADGAGSASLSHYGAECIVESMSIFLSINFQELINNDDGKQVKLNIMSEIQKVISDKANELNCKSNDLASTLLLVAICDNNYIIVHIGDGVIGYLDGETLKIASHPDNGEYANVTNFVTSNDALTTMRLFKGNIKDISGFILMSDGTEQSLYHKKTKSLAGAVIKLMHRTSLIDGDIMKLQLLDTLTSVIRRNTLDDCSVAILVRPYGFLRTIENLTDDEKRDLFGISPRSKNIKKRISRYDEIISVLRTPKTLRQVASEIHLRPKYIEQHLNKLLSFGLIVQNSDQYSKL